MFVNPEDNATGFLSETVDALRYENVNEHRLEVAALIAGFVPEGARVLDVGCGTGGVSALIQRRKGARIVGVEPNAERARAARGRGIEVVEGYLTTELVEALGPFNVVVFADVLEHLGNPSALLQLGCAALERDGVVVISVPNIAHWSVRWALLGGRFDYEQFGIMDATHLRWFTAESLGRWLQNNGLVVEAMKHSAGTTLPVYTRAWPWRWIPEDTRLRVIRRLVRVWPLLFGCQHIVRASRMTA